MNKWNKIGKFKSITILILSLINLIISEPIFNEFHLVILIIFFLFTSIFIILVTKIWNLFGLKFEKPNWNESSLSLNFSKIFNFFHFFAYLFIFSGLTNILFFAVFYLNFNFGDLDKIMYGLGIIIGIKISLKIQK